MIYSVTNDDQEEQDTITRLRDPEIYIGEGYDQELMKEAMNKEMEDMKLHDVYEEVSVDGLPPETIRDAIDTRWVHKYKTPTQMRSRIVGKGYNEKIEDSDSIYASTPLFVILRLLLILALARGWKIRLQLLYMLPSPHCSPTHGRQRSTTRVAGRCGD